MQSLNQTAMPPLPTALHAQPVSQTPVTQAPAPTHVVAGGMNAGALARRQHPNGGVVGPTPGTSATPPVTPNALSPIDQFANSAGMQFQLQQGANTLNNMYAARGAVQSGAAAKALQSYGQNTALQNYFFPYMNYLSGQQAMGAQAASAIGGVGSSFGSTMNGLGQNYSNAVTGINQGAAGAIGQGALNIGQANANNAAIHGYGGAQIGSAIGSGLGSIASSFLPRY